MALAHARGPRFFRYKRASVPTTSQLWRDLTSYRTHNQNLLQSTIFTVIVVICELKSDQTLFEHRLQRFRSILRTLTSSSTTQNRTKMMWWAIWCAVVVASSACADAVPSDNLAQPIDWAQLESSVPDDESLGYAVPPMTARYAAGAPLVYLLAEVPRDSQRYPEREGRSRPKRKMPSLSINNPMEVLRQRLLLEVARKQMREANQRQAVVNRVFLQNVGKRGFWANSVSSRYDN